MSHHVNAVGLGVVMVVMAVLLWLAVYWLVGVFVGALGMGMVVMYWNLAQNVAERDRRTPDD